MAAPEESAATWRERGGIPRAPAEVTSGLGEDRDGDMVRVAGCGCLVHRSVVQSGQIKPGRMTTWWSDEGSMVS